MSPFFSIIVPTYNRSKFIVEAIRSIQQQEYLLYEVLIIDDGSTDDTAECIRREFSADTKVKYYYKENGERGAARNQGIKNASGTHAVFFDSDDLMKPTYLKSLVAIIESVSPTPNFIALKYNFITNQGSFTASSMEHVKSGWYTLDDFLKGNMLACNYCIRITSDLVLFPEQRELATMEDWLFLLSNLNNKNIYISDQYGVSMRDHVNRSVMDNSRVIRARMLAEKWALKHLEISERQRQDLIAWSRYFCGIHQYLDFNRVQSVKEAFSAIRFGGLKFHYLLLLVKSIIGKRLIKRFQ